MLKHTAFLGRTSPTVCLDTSLLIFVEGMENEKDIIEVLLSATHLCLSVAFPP